MNKPGLPGRAASRHDDTQTGLVLASRLTDEHEPPKLQASAGLFRLLAEDVRTVVERDPSVRTFTEALLHPALPALCTHRVAHLLHERGARLSARALMTAARALTGTEIHPGATLGRRVFIDHGAAVVIGETAVVGDDVTIYHQVTLGAVGWWRDNRRPPGERRHPVVGNGTVLGTGATVLGPVTIGDQVIVGAQALVLTDIPDDAHVTATSPPAQPPTALPRIAHTP
ncbi:Serine acetyltransferase [Streptomyces sp. ADI92-24]|nr:Serine acetyltransferase [Streptomyces sp. ADI92-24]